MHSLFREKLGKEKKQRDGYEEAAPQYLIIKGILWEHSQEKIMITELQQVIAKNNKFWIT